MATIPSRKATFTEEEKRKLVEGTDAQGKPLSESEKMKLSKMHTARTLGADWRERGAERMKAEEPARAQQALAERAAANRKTQYESPLQETVTKAEIDLPGGGKVKYGIDTLARMRDFETKQAEEKAALQAKREGALSAMRQKAGTALRQRYEDELASRGFAPPKTRQEQEAIDRARMDEFRTVSAARQAAKERSSNAQKEYRQYNALAKLRLASGDIAGAEELRKLADETGGFIKSSSARNRFIENQEMDKARAAIGAKVEARKAKMQAQNISNPEASSFTPTSSAAPLAIGSDMPSYQLPYQRPAGPIEQGFGMTTPAMADYGVDFSSISPYNVGGFALPQIAESPVSQEAFSKLTAKQKDELISEQIRRGLESTGRGIYRGGKAALKAILEGARAIR